MEIIFIKNRDVLNSFVGGQEFSQFLQSWEWGELQKKIGRKIIRVGVENYGNLIAAATLIKIPLFWGKSYFYCPRGPIINQGGQDEAVDKKQAIKFLFSGLQRVAKEEKAIFLRFEPTFNIKNLFFNIEKTIDIQPSQTLILDLSKAEDQILAAMQQKTRYNIRLADRKDLEIIEGGENNFNDFWRLLKETKKRDGFKLHKKIYYQQLFSLPSDFIKIFLAQHQNQYIAAVIIIFFGDTAVYVYGASSNKKRNLMATYLLQWRAINFARQIGEKFFDFYGVDEKKWPGVTRFKKGFGGKLIVYPGTFDLIFNKKIYAAYKGVRKFRRLFKYI